MHFNLFFVAVCLSVLLLLSACGTTVTEQPISERERITFSEKVLANAYSVQKYMALCKTMSEATVAEVQAIEKQWLIDYWARISLADSEYRAHINQLKSLQGDKVALVKPVTLALKVDQAQHSAIERINNHYNNRDGRCLRLLKSQITESELLLSAEENARVITVLTSEHTKAVSPFRVLLDYQAGLAPTHVAKGRSLFKAENMSFQYCGGIENANVVVMDQSGSAEYYGVTCENGKIAFIRCQFGQCQLNPPSE